jgi:hypothetical protein
VGKLASLGPALPYPHSSKIMGDRGDITPSGHEPQLIGKRARRNALESFQGNGYAVVVAAT